MKENLKKYLVEFVGVFIFMFTILSSIYFDGANVIAPVMIGITLMVLVYAGGHISGGHYNPAVSLAAAIKGALDWKQLLPYWLCQLSAAALAALLVGAISPASNGFAHPYLAWQILLGEFIFTFLLCFVVLSSACSKATEGNSYYGFAIGGTVLAGAFAVGGILCFAAFNPAVALGLGVIGSACVKCVILTILANLLGAVAAGYFFKFCEK